MEKWQLQQLQGLPLAVKIEKSKVRIQEWYEHYEGDVYISFSGGKDSTVLLHLVRSLYPDVKAVFSDTGLEYPEIRDFVKTIDNVTWMKPIKLFKDVVNEFGYPIISKKVARQIRDLKKPEGVNDATKNLILTGYNRKGVFRQFYKISDKWVYLKDAPFKVSEECCDWLKKEPFKRYEKENGGKPYIGILADESQWRTKKWLQHGCNAFDASVASSMPLAFWTENDVLEYIRRFNLPYAKEVYGEILEDENGNLKMSKLDRTGCMFCMFGVHMETGKNRFQLMKENYPQQYDYCINKLGCGEVLDYIGIDYK